MGAVREAAAGARPQRGEAWDPEAAAAAMPLLFLERFPWPSLRTYTGLSGLALLGAVISAYRALSQPEAEAGPGPGDPEPITAPVQPDPTAVAGPGAGGPGVSDVAQYLLSDSLFVWVSEAARAPRRSGAGRAQGPRCHPLSGAGGVAGAKAPSAPTTEYGAGSRCAPPREPVGLGCRVGGQEIGGVLRRGAPRPRAGGRGRRAGGGAAARLGPGGREPIRD